MAFVTKPRFALLILTLKFPKFWPKVPLSLFWWSFQKHSLSKPAVKNNLPLVFSIVCFYSMFTWVWEGCLNLSSDFTLPPRKKHIFCKWTCKTFLVRKLFVTCDVFTRYFFRGFVVVFSGFFVALICLQKKVFGPFSANPESATAVKPTPRLN